MPTYRITEKKVREHLGKEFEEIVNPFKSPRFVISLVVLLSFTFLLAFATYKAWASPFFGWFFLFYSVICAAASVGAHFWFRQINLDNILPRMRDLVNDHALLWLNAKSPHEKKPRAGK